MSLSKLDVYMRIKHHFEYLIKQGGFLPGESLPSVRQVALDMGVNPNTVQKAYQLLADENLVHILPKKGVFVKEQLHPLESPLKEQLQNLIKELLVHYSKEEIQDFIKNILSGEEIHD